MKKSITPICDYYTVTPGNNKVVVFQREVTPGSNKIVVFQREEDTGNNALLTSVAIGMIVSIIAALIMIPAMYDVRGGFYVGGEFLFCAAVGVFVGKVVWNGLKTRS
jgi:hypothetical protein